MKTNRIHVGFGFHVNCYHSYRGDTNDENGFGSDIRIIRGIISALDSLNAKGIPVKGTWDFENLFSLENILPRYAPDIIEGVRRRVKENGDENIIMGYSNGALGAMQRDELEASVKWAVSNAGGSGLRDLFGGCAPVVRPQEVMFSPSQAGAYRALGVKALCLYYSCVPFDAFKTLIPPLGDEKAFNPLTFRYGGGEITVLPTYSNADVCDAGCLRAWVRELREKQVRGLIDRDLFLFINMDADAVFWESLSLPVVGNRLANTDGIRGLVNETADLDYVVYDTPGGYLENHAPAGEVRFTHDTADGNFTGYASWAEKPYNRKIWTAVERGRMADAARGDGANLAARVKLLSTTHFGLASPVLNIEREKAADALAEELRRSALRTEGPLTLHNIAGSRLLCAQFACALGAPPVFSGEGLETAACVPVGESVFAMLRFGEVKKEYRIAAAPAPVPAQGPVSRAVLESGGARLTLTPAGVESFTFRGKTVGGKGFLSSYITYGGKRYRFIPDGLSAAPVSGGRGAALTGRILLPGAVRQGRFSFLFFTADAAEGIFVATDVRYPYTPERDAISTENSTLGRYTDNRWQEAVPFCLSPEISGDTRVIKRNFEGDISSFRTASFAGADPRNETLASFNNQLTAGFVGLTDGWLGLMLGFSRAVLSSMAACPMRLEAGGRVRMNPFGTFFGPQRRHPNRSKDIVPDTYSLIAPQSGSLAPSYNGSGERAVMCLLPFEGEMPEEERLRDLLAFADGAFVSGRGDLISPFVGDNAAVHAAESVGGAIKMRSPLLGRVKGNVGKFVYRGARAVAYIAWRQRKSMKP